MSLVFTNYMLYIDCSSYLWSNISFCKDWPQAITVLSNLHNQWLSNPGYGLRSTYRWASMANQCCLQKCIGDRFGQGVLTKCEVDIPELSIYENLKLETAWTITSMTTLPGISSSGMGMAGTIEASAEYSPAIHECSLEPPASPCVTHDTSRIGWHMQDLEALTVNLEAVCCCLRCPLVITH